MVDFSDEFRTVFNKKAITKEEFINQMTEIVNYRDPAPLSPELFEFAVKWMYRKYKLGLYEKN